VIYWRDQPCELAPARLGLLYRELPAADVLLIEARRAAGEVVLLHSEVRAAAMRQLSARLQEQGGLLVGQVYTDAGSRADEVALLQVRAAVPSTDACGSRVALRMESGVWTRAKEALLEGERIVGWYHSHPGLGAFFSETDRNTQRAFFSHPYSLGWVIDPVNGEERWFLGARCEELPASRVLTRTPEHRKMP
jgi:proteasome lid subunit RPN8/RPN11